MLSKELIKSGSKTLKDNGIEEPIRKAEILLSDITKRKIPDLYITEEKVPEEIIKKYTKYLKKLLKGLPLQYITKKVDFYKYQFYVEEGVFIPRPETEILVEKALEIYKHYFSPYSIKILDIGTGCGNIAITIAKEIKNCKILATDISEKALKTAIHNAKAHKVKSRVQFLKANIFPPEKSKFHIIVSNPPYIPHAEIGSLDREVQREPMMALDGEKDGLAIIKKIIEGAEIYLYNNGFLLMEIGEEQRKDIEKIKGGLVMIDVIKDLAGSERVIIFQKDKG